MRKNLDFPSFFVIFAVESILTMKVILTPAMAKELYENEDMIKKQEGPYRPQYRASVIPGVNLPVMGYVPVIKNWPLEKFEGQFIQEREVIPGMEEDVDDICMAKIQDGRISYRKNKILWVPAFDPFKRVMPEWIPLKEYSILIYTPYFDNETIFMTEDSLGELFAKFKEFQIVNEKDEEPRTKGRMSYNALFENIDDWFKKFQGVCTYIFFKGDKVIKCGTWENKKYW